jgi:RNA polymerase primary sigma factor
MKFETSDNLPKYFKSIQKIKVLTVEQEKELGEKIAAGCTRSVNTLVEHNLKLVVKLANKHIGQGVLIDDLIQEGNLGLIHAAQRFDSTRDGRFATYASLWIRKYLNEKVVEHGRIVRLPHNQEYEIYKAKKAGKETPNLRAVDIDAPVRSDDGHTTIGDILLNGKPEIESSIEMDSVKFKVSVFLSHLKERDQAIIKDYFGIGRDCAIPTDVLAERYGMSNVRISQIVKAALTKLKQVV